MAYDRQVRRVTADELRAIADDMNNLTVHSQRGRNLLRAAADTLDDLDKDIAVLEETVCHLEQIVDSTGQDEPEY